MWVGQRDLDGAFVAKLVGVTALAGLIMFFIRLYQVRTWFRQEMKKHDVQILPHSFLFGHLMVIGKVVATYPGDFSKLATVHAVLKVYPELISSGVVYMDIWPFGKPTVAVFHPEIMAQFTQEKSLHKADEVRRELGPLTHLRDLVTMEGPEWKRWRSIFNPGFSAKNLIELLPAFLEEIQVLKERFTETAISGKTIIMEDTVQEATVDVICRAVLGIRLHSQTQNVPFVKQLQNQIWWLVCDEGLACRIKESFPLRSLFIWNNNRKMDNFLAPIIEDAAVQLDRATISGPKTINQLAIKAYRSEVKQSTASIDPRFMEVAIAQLKIFIFAGHDTTASTLSFAYSRLYKEPAALAKIRAEHDRVLGPDPSQTFARLTENPMLLNQMPYTAAVIKETLRLYPPAATARKGDMLLTHPETGKTYPTAGFMIWASSWVTHRLSEYFERPDEFLPERFLVPEGDPLHPRKNTWRPFELGPRSCIGLELAQVELRAILAMTLRDFDFEPRYAEDAPEALGEKAYQTMGFGDITGHVKDGFPVKVHLRTREGSKQ